MILNERLRKGTWGVEPFALLFLPFMATCYSHFNSDTLEARTPAFLTQWITNPPPVFEDQS